MGNFKFDSRKFFRVAAVQTILLISICVPFTSAAVEDERFLLLFNVHTGDRAEIVYKRNGKYSEKGLGQLNNFLRDWRRNKQIEMDPRLFDLLWEIYAESDSQNHIHVVSAYRTSATNEMLRGNSNGVARNSQHTKGKAIDFYLPDVSLAKLQTIAMKKQGGGVGIYPSSNSPFAHVDTGSVRHWPRLTRKQLAGMFPDGRTAHVPNDGIPLSAIKIARSEVQKTPQDEGIAVLANHLEDIFVPRPKPASSQSSSFKSASLSSAGAHIIPRANPRTGLSDNKDSRAESAVSSENNTDQLNEFQLAIPPRIKPETENQPEFPDRAETGLASRLNNQKQMVLAYFSTEEPSASIKDLNLVFAEPNQKTESINPSPVTPRSKPEFLRLIRKSNMAKTRISNTIEQSDSGNPSTTSGINSETGYELNTESESKDTKFAGFGFPTLQKNSDFDKAPGLPIDTPISELLSNPKMKPNGNSKEMETALSDSQDLESSANRGMHRNNANQANNLAREETDNFWKRISSIILSKPKEIQRINLNLSNL